MLDPVELFLGGLSVTDQVQELRILLVYDSELLVEEIFYGIACMEGLLVVYDGRGCTNAVTNGL